MAEIWLVCEGEPNSVDVTLLRKIFDEVVLEAGIIVRSGGGGNSLGSIAQFLSKLNDAKEEDDLNERYPNKAAYVQDRDYRPRQVAEESMADGKPGFFWRRHTIENYLLPPAIISRSFQLLLERFERQMPGSVPPWIDRLSADDGVVADALRECARRRAAHEACRMANARLWAELPHGVGRVQRRDPNASDSEEPSVWRDALCHEAELVCRAATETAACENFRREAVSALFDASYGEITAEVYIRDMEFLVDFHGKDLLAAFSSWLRDQGVPSRYLESKRFLNLLMVASIDVYREDRTIYGRDDFRDLANGVRSLAGLAPLP